MTIEDQIKKECWDNSFHNLGTSYIFQERVKCYKILIKIITILGLAVPLILGGIVLSYGNKSIVLLIALLIAAPLSILQIALSGISLALGWDDKLAISLESQTDNRIIGEEFEKLAKFPPNNIDEFRMQFEIIKIKDQSRKNQDDKISFSNREIRKGMRYALWIRQKECATCKIIPVAMTPTNCKTCGNF
jgi:mobilome CxxCx(11)CxxC protein